MKVASIIGALRCLLRDCAGLCSTNFPGRDIQYIEHRCKHEGMSFVTISLTNFCDDFLKSLEEGYVDSSTSFQGWKKNKCLPAFLQGFTSRVFDIRTGSLLNEPHIESIKSIRQICLFAKKINLPCTEERIANAIDSYIQIDDELRDFKPPASVMERFKQVSRVVVSTLFPEIVYAADLIPKHGPGVTAEGVKGNQKYRPIHFPWYHRLRTDFPIGTNGFTSDECYHSYRGRVEITRSAPVVNVVTVPKTLKTPRIIAEEPTSIQYTQQAIKELVVSTIESNSLTRGHINFSDQSVNKELALKNSVDQQLATLDLSAASDRVSRKLVKAMLEVNPSLSHLVFLTRSPIAKVGEKRINLQKFASMGSALCFPIEALAFFCLCLLNRLEHVATPYGITLKALRALAKDVYVYGDDILIPVNEVETAITLFQQFKLKVSTTKSFWKGEFRESCGMDAFRGVDITPTYLRQPFASSRREASQIVSNVATANQLWLKGYTATFYYIKNLVEGAVGEKLPSIADDSEGLGWVGGFYPGKTRYNKLLQRMEVRSFVPSIVKKTDDINGYPALTKCLLRLHYGTDNDPMYSEYEYRSLKLDPSATSQDHLMRTPRRGALTLKRRWVPRIRPRAIAA